MSVVLHHGKLEDVLPTLAADSVDACVTDTPYHLTVGKKGGTGPASVNLNTPRARARVTTGFMGMTWDGGDVAFRVETWREVFRVLKPGAYLLAFGGTRTHHRMVCAVEDAGFEIRDEIDWVFGSGFPKGINLEDEWDGWGTGLKPAKEPICLARKPLVGTVEANIALHRTGAINIDGCRVPLENGEDISVERNEAALDTAGAGWGFKGVSRDNSGRWPANLIHDGSPEVIALFPAEAGAAAPVTTRNGDKFRSTYGAFAGNIDEAGSTFHADSGSAARFFYCAKASREDRDAGCELLAMLQRDITRQEGAPGGENPRNRGVQLRHNFHPTVKPTALMRYLCRLVTPPQGTVLDIFMGSGSTGRGAVLEGFNFVGIEMTDAYMPIARARVAHAEKEKIGEDEASKVAAAQMSLFPANHDDQ